MDTILEVEERDSGGLPSRQGSNEEKNKLYEMNQQNDSKQE